MPSFDVVSEVNRHELTNALDQTRRELGNRFDFKGVDFGIEDNGDELILHAESDYQVRQLFEVLCQRAVKRGIDITAFTKEEPVASGKLVKMTVKVQNGIDSETAKKIVKHIKDTKLKVQAQIQGDKIRVSGKKRDDLQAVIASLRAASFGLPLQFENFRD
ncbi:MAG: YajQ family cyclic di-GMP-binding protein [Gammaproteobacteria bacterium]|nr:MAG: YajQ family cyclic di-GMP-binding protein [Gammaproteobacteria bacterium]